MKVRRKPSSRHHPIRDWLVWWNGGRPAKLMRKRRPPPELVIDFGMPVIMHPHALITIGLA